MRRFGTFEGVFLPTFLSILGVIMYLRLGWVVGQTGLKGALIIIVISNAITLFTGLSISSIATNMKVGTGGAYAIISKSLGYQIGGAVGIPLYISQAVSVAFYITGFTECWTSVFPSHSFLLTSCIVWFILLIVSYTSAKLAFRLQYVILLIIVLSLISALKGKGPAEPLPLWSDGVGEFSFWQVFAIFFPAVTGILSGVSMSGELKKPERDIPRGTLLAIGISFIIYLSLSVWFSRNASSEELAANTSIILDLSRWRILIIGGIMGATLSSALSMFVASPRTLLALGKHRVIPLSRLFSRISPNGEPTPAILVTAMLAILTIFFGSLNTIAELLTMFFLITYGLLNLAVFIEQGIGIVSFRPSFRVHLIFPVLGFAGCLLAMFLINPLFSLIAVVIITGIYFALIQREVRTSWPDVRRGLFVFIAEKAIKTATDLPYHPKTWKPNLLIPVEQPDDWIEMVDFIKTVISPSGRVYLLKVVEFSSDPLHTDGKMLEDMIRRKHEAKLSMEALGGELKDDGILSSSVIVDSRNFYEGVRTALQTLSGSFLPPNILFIKLGSMEEKDLMIEKIFERDADHSIGIMLLGVHPQVGLGQSKWVNLWVRDKSPNVNLSILISLQIKRNWDGNLRILQVVKNQEEAARARNYLTKLIRVMRIPDDAEIEVLVGDFSEALKKAPEADINIFGMASEVDLSWIRSVSEKVGTSVLFLRDSKIESAFA